MADIEDIDDDASNQADGLSEQSQAAAGEGADDSGRDAQGDGTQTEGSDGQGDGGEDGGVVITIGEEQPPQDDQQRAPEWVRDLRKSNREKDRRIRELEQQVAQVRPVDAAVVLGPKPTLANPTGNEADAYDEEKFAEALQAWHERDAKIKSAAAARQEEERRAQDAWSQRMQEYSKRKTELAVPDFEDAEDVFEGTLSQVQRGIILNGADKPEVVVYALGKAPAKLKELAKISDPVKFCFAVAKLETQLKVTPRKVAPAPEKRVQGQAPVTGSIESQLAALEAEALKTGDRSKVAAFRREQRRAQA
jgi:hypothetical protein